MSFDHEEINEQHLNEGGLTWHDIESANEQAAAREHQLRESVAESIRRKKGYEIDAGRLSDKEILLQLTDEGGEYRMLAGDDPALVKIMDQVNKYARIDATATHGNYKNEVKSFTKALESLEAYRDRMDKDPENDTEKKRMHYLVCANLQFMMEAQRDGSLMFSDEDVKAGSVVDGTQHPITSNQSAAGFIDAGDMPLFPHEPSPNDIAQGYLGNCYMMASLSTIAARFPDQIRKNIRDNGDGTCTVRFWEKLKPGTADEVDEKNNYKPVFVTVDKKYHETDNSEHCLWAEIYERAYAASGLHITTDKYIKPVPENVDELFMAAVEHPDDPQYSPEECPWIYDKDGHLRQWRPDYSDIEGGFSYRMTEQLLGPDAPGELIDVAQACKAYKDQLANQLQEQKDLRGERDFGGALWQKMLTALHEQKLGVKALPEYTNERGELETRGSAYPVYDLVFDFKDHTLTAAEMEVMQTIIAVVGNNAFAKAFRTEEGLRDPAGSLTAQLDAVREAARKVAEGIPNNDRTDIAYIMMNSTLQKNKDGFPADKLLHAVDTIVSGIKEVMPQFMDRIPELKREHEAYTAEIDRLQALRDDEQRTYVEPAKYSGQYGKEDQFLYDTIKNALDRGDLVNAGTPGKSDKNTTNGLADKHAYSVLGIRKAKVDGTGPELTFVTIRNPWGTSDSKTQGFTYHIKKGQVVCKTGRAMKEGIMEIELSDFRKGFDNLYINHVSPELLADEKRHTPDLTDEQRAAFDRKIADAQAARNARESKLKNELRAPKKPTAFTLSGDTRVKWGKTLRQVREHLMSVYSESAKGRDSQQVTDLRNELDTVCNYLLPQGKDMPARELEDSLNPSFKKASAYLAHCRREPKDGIRRKTRMEAAEMMLDLKKAVRQNYADPAKYFEDQLVNTLYEQTRLSRLAKCQSDDDRQSINEIFDDEQHKQNAEQQIRESSAFRSFFKSGDICRLSVLLHAPEQAYKQFMSGLAKQQAAEKDARPAAAQASKKAEKVNAAHSVPEQEDELAEAFKANRDPNDEKILNMLNK